MSITALQPHDVSARIHYFKDAEDGSHPTLEEIEFLVPKFVDAQQVTIRNVRGFEKDFNFTDHGFQFLQSEWPFEGPLDDETAVEQVRPAAEELLKKWYACSCLLQTTRLTAFQYRRLKSHCFQSCCSIFRKGADGHPGSIRSSCPRTQ